MLNNFLLPSQFVPTELIILCSCILCVVFMKLPIHQTDVKLLIYLLVILLY
jgi:hypothetical protein